MCMFLPFFTYFNYFIILHFRHNLDKVVQGIQIAFTGSEFLLSIYCTVNFVRRLPFV